MFHKRLGSVRVRDEELSLRIVSDDHPLCELAARLWRDVYGDEFGYLAKSGDDSSLVTRGRRSMVILALRGEQCVGSLRMAYKKHTPSEFEFAHCPRSLEGELGALSRLVVAREFRKTALSLHMLSQCHKFHRECSEATHYDHVLVSCAPEMLHFYRTFGFELADGPREELDLHRRAVSRALLARDQRSDGGADRSRPRRRFAGQSADGPALSVLRARALAGPARAPGAPSIAR